MPRSEPTISTAMRFRQTTALELAFLRIITRGYPAVERQIESCLVSEWDEGYLDVHAIDGPPMKLTRNPAIGPAVETGLEDAPYLDCIFWTDEAGMIASVEVSIYGIGKISDFVRMSIFVDAAQNDPARLSYCNNITR